MTQLGDYLLEVDWDGDSLFANTYSDVSGDLIPPIVTSRGRDYGSMVYGRSIAGTLSNRLRNTNSNRYDRFNSSSPLHELVVPGRQVRLLMGLGMDTAIVRAQLTAGTQLWPSGGTVATGGDLILEPNLTIDSLNLTTVSGQLNRFQMTRTTASTVAMSAFWSDTGGGSRLSVYIQNAAGARMEIPYSLLGTTTSTTAEWDIDGDGEAALRTFLGAIASSQQFWLIVDRRDIVKYVGTGNVGYSSLWSGYLDNPTPTERRGGRDELELKALGILSRLSQHEVSVPMQTTIKSGPAIRVLLDAADITAGARGRIDEGEFTLGRWWGRLQPVIKSIREVEDTEGGFSYEDARGRYAFDGLYRRLLQRTSVLAFTDDPQATYIPVITDEPQDPAQDIANIVRIPVRQYTVAATAVLWTLGETPLLRVGASITFVAEYPNENSPAAHLAVDTWNTLVATADYTANTAANGTGTNLTTSLGVTVTDTANSRTMELTNNHATLDMYVTLLQVRGQALVAGQPYNVEIKDQDSIDDYGPQDHLAPGQFLADAQDATEYGRFILALQKDPLRKAAITVNANDHLQEMTTLDLSDRVMLVSRGLAQDMFVESIEHRIDAGLRHDVRLVLSPSLPYGNVIILDTGPGLDTGILGR